MRRFASPRTPWSTGSWMLPSEMNPTWIPIRTTRCVGSGIGSWKPDRGPEMGWKGVRCCCGSPHTGWQQVGMKW